MNVKLEEQELQELRQMRIDSEQLIRKVGQIELQIYDVDLVLKELENRKKSFLDEYDALKLKEKQKVEELSKKYGDGNINIETGEFTKITTPQSSETEPLVSSDSDKPL